MPNKVPSYLESTKLLQPGDILLFMAEDHPSFAQVAIMSTQTFLSNQKDGIPDITHVAIVVDDDDSKGGQGGNKGPTIAHITEDEGISGYQKEFLSEMFSRGEDRERRFLVYRPRNQWVAHQIAQKAGQKENELIKWRSLATTQIICRSGIVEDYDQSTIDTYSFCSKFAIQVIKNVIQGKEIKQESEKTIQENDKMIQEAGKTIKKARKKIHKNKKIISDARETIQKAGKTIQEAKKYTDYYPNIPSPSTPEALEGYLYKNEGYELLSYVSNERYSMFEEAVKCQIDQLNESEKVEKAQAANESETEGNKYKEAQAAYDEYKNDPKNKELDPLQRSIALAQKMIPIFQGPKCEKTTACKTLFQALRDLNIFERNFNFERSFLPSTAQERHTYKIIWAAIAKQIDRLSRYRSQNDMEKKKYEKSETIFHKATERLKEGNFDARQETLLLVWEILPSFQFQKGWNYDQITFYKEILQMLAQLNISEDDVKNSYYSIISKDNSYETMQKVICWELARLSQYVKEGMGNIGWEKHSSAKKEYDSTINDIEMNLYDPNDLREKYKEEKIKAIILSRRVLTAFKIHREWGFGHTRSTKAVLDAVKRLNIREEDVLIEDLMWNSEVIAPKVQPL